MQSAAHAHVKDCPPVPNLASSHSTMHTAPYPQVLINAKKKNKKQKTFLIACYSTLHPSWLVHWSVSLLVHWSVFRQSVGLSVHQTLLFWFWGATKHLYNWLCPLVCWSVSWVMHSFENPHVAPYWPTWPCFFLAVFGLTNSAQMIKWPKIQPLPTRMQMG